MLPCSMESLSTRKESSSKQFSLSSFQSLSDSVPKTILTTLSTSITDLSLVLLSNTVAQIKAIHVEFHCTKPFFDCIIPACVMHVQNFATSFLADVISVLVFNNECVGLRVKKDFVLFYRVSITKIPEYKGVLK